MPSATVVGDTGPEGPALGWTVVVTRPSREAPAWVAALAQAGFNPVALPLMAFGPSPQSATLSACMAGLPGYRALMFVSPQAVHAFWAEFLKENGLQAQDRHASIASFFDNSNTRQLRCWAPGPGTARALREVGVPAQCIDQPAPDAGQFDSEALWAVVQPQVRAGDRVLLVRGDTRDIAGRSTSSTGSGRDWFASQCVAIGASVAHCVAYSRVPPEWDDAQRAQAANASGTSWVWLFSSSESVGHLARLLPGHDWSATCALATHPRIAEAVRRLGFGRVMTCRPALGDVVCALQREGLRTGPPKMGALP